MSEMKLMCSRCEKEVENANAYNFYVLHKECFRDHAEKLIDEFLEDLKYSDPEMIKIKWEGRKSEV